VGNLNNIFFLQRPIERVLMTLMIIHFLATTLFVFGMEKIAIVARKIPTWPPAAPVDHRKKCSDAALPSVNRGQSAQIQVKQSENSPTVSYEAGCWVVEPDIETNFAWKATSQRGNTPQPAHSANFTFFTKIRSRRIKVIRETKTAKTIASFDSSTSANLGRP
jgi:hypothetical protein